MVGDRYAGEWPREQFSKFGIRYEPSSKTKSDLYVDLLPLVNSARIQLLDYPKMINQLLALERRTARGGKDSIDHPSGGHDDLINAVAGAASCATAKQIDTTMAWVEGAKQPFGRGRSPTVESEFPHETYLCSQIGEPTMSAKPTYWMKDRQISEDEALDDNGIVKDGVRTRFPTFMRDSAGNMLVDALGQPLQARSSWLCIRRC